MGRENVERRGSSTTCCRRRDRSRADRRHFPAAFSHPMPRSAEPGTGPAAEGSIGSAQTGCPGRAAIPGGTSCAAADSSSTSPTMRTISGRPVSRRDEDGDLCADHATAPPCQDQRCDSSQGDGQDCGRDRRRQGQCRSAEHARQHRCLIDEAGPQISVEHPRPP